MMMEKIKGDLIAAQKNKEENKVSTLRMLVAAVNNKAISKRALIAGQEPGLSEDELAKKSELSDQEIVESIFSEAKKRREAAREYEKGGRSELAQKEKQELEILSSYLPAQMEEEEIRKLAAEAIQKTGAESNKDIGKVMGVLMPQTKGKADGSLVGRVVKELLQGK